MVVRVPRERSADPLLHFGLLRNEHRRRDWAQIVHVSGAKRGSARFQWLLAASRFLRMRPLVGVICVARSRKRMPRAFCPIWT